MAFINFIARIAARMPYTIQKVRSFKNGHKWPALKGPIEKKRFFHYYVAQHGIQNRDNRRWALMADKYAVREEIERLLGPGHLIPLLGAWERPEDIDFDSLPESFILKTNNGCGTNIFVHNKNDIDRQSIVNRLRKDLYYPYPQLTGQLHYALIKPMVVAEEIIVQDGGHKSLTDYKIHCVNGEPRTVYVFEDRDEVNHFDFTMRAYTPKWQLIPPEVSPLDVADEPQAPNRPVALDEMLDMARKLSAGEEYVRVDFYYTDGKILFGEMTFMPDTWGHSCYHRYQPAMHYLLDLVIKERQP